MNLDRLTVFLRVVETGSVTAAAKRVHLTQPAVTRNLQLLEEDLRVKLFERRGRGLVLTAAGRALAARARDLLASAEGVALEVARSAERTYFDVRIGSVDSVATYLLPRALERLRPAFPQLAVKLDVGRTAHLLERIRLGSLDLAVVAHSGPPADARAHEIGAYVLRYYGRRDRFPALARATSLTEIQRFPVVEIEAGPGQSSLIPDGALSYAVATNMASVKALVLAGFGVGDLLDFILTPEEREKLVCANLKLDPHCGFFLAGTEAWVGESEGRIEAALGQELRTLLARPASARSPARSRAGRG